MNSVTKLNFKKGDFMGDPLGERDLREQEEHAAWQAPDQTQPTPPPTPDQPSDEISPEVQREMQEIRERLAKIEEENVNGQLHGFAVMGGLPSEKAEQLNIHDMEASQEAIDQIKKELGVSDTPYGEPFLDVKYQGFINEQGFEGIAAAALEQFTVESNPYLVFQVWRKEHRDDQGELDTKGEIIAQRFVQSLSPIEKE